LVTSAALVASSSTERATTFTPTSASELCWRWRTSFTALQHTVSPGERLRLITSRSELLDELARRDPERFQRWLDSGARAASDPARFLTHLHHTPPCPTNTANRDRRFTVRLHSRRRHRHCADGPQRR